MGNKKLYADIVIGEKTRGTIIPDMGRYDVSTKVSIMNVMKYRRTPGK